jgi:thiol-disulfide isomerase/thioredoxin
MLKGYHFIFVFVISSGVSQSQTFNDCASELRSKWKKIQIDAATQKRDEKKMDSLYRALESTFNSCIIGKELPAFNLMSIEGKSFTNESLSGKVVYLNIWTINCGACWSEIPVLNKIDTVYNGNKDFVFISLLLDEEQDLSDFLQRRKIGWPIEFEVVANEAPFGNKDLKKSIPFPTHLFIDRNGKISKKLVGSFPDSKVQEEFLRAAIDELLVK